MGNMSIQSKNIQQFILFPMAFLLFSSCSKAFQDVTNLQDSNQLAEFSHFVEVRNNFPREEKNIRKWDAPLAADLDQDGYMDLILNDHGLGIKICWNNSGIFEKPYDLIMGDLHGVSIGDYDMDGNLELILSRGGGSGSNARNSKMYTVDKRRKFTEVPDFDVPLDLMRGRTVNFVDADNDGDLDLLNFAFPDKSKNGVSENYVYENDGQGQMGLHSTLPASYQNGQKTLTTDINSDNKLDIILYGHKDVLIFQGNGDLTYENVTSQYLPNNVSNVTSVAEIDYDNDGDFDLFMTRGEEFEIGETFYDAETKNWGFFTKRGDFRFDDLEIGDVINLTNFQSQWPDNDAYHIGETGYAYEFPGETHSGKDIRLVNSDALGFPDSMTESGIYVGYVGNRSWRIAGKTNAPTTGVVKGVESYPAYNHSPGFAAHLFENKNGVLKEVSAQANIEIMDHTMASTVADIDNNGYDDIIVIRRGDLIHDNESIVLLNKGNGTFEEQENHGIVTTELGAIGMAIGNIDYNQDGNVDVVIGNERGLWYLFKNQRSPIGHATITIEVGNSPSGKATALGALVKLNSCGNNQIFRVGATASNYSLSHDTHVHFGLGNCENEIQIEILWTNGETERLTASSKEERIQVGKR